MTSPQPSADAPRRRRRNRDRDRRPNAPATTGGRAANDGPSSPSITDDVITASPVVTASFAELGVPQPIIAALHAMGATTPFPIQAATLPDTLAGRDVLGRGKTGSGKTIAFAIPTVKTLDASGRRREPRRPRALVLAPTRELAAQVAETFAPIAAAMKLRVAVIFGGVGQAPQVAALRNGVDVLVACPGRLEDLIAQGHCSLDRVEVTVLDEADHMADLGFLPSVTRLLDQTPSGAQRMLFSATLDKGIDVLVRRYLNDPVTHSLDPAVSPVSTMTHRVFAILAADKPAVIRELAGGEDRSLLFMRTKHGAKKLAKQLTASGIPAVELHGNLSQNVRERNLQSFATGAAKVLVATDIAARGIHIDEVALVVHVDPPAEHKAYLHRSGRTARAGASGIVVTLMTPDQVNDVKALTRAARIEPLITRIAPGDALITSLVGPPAAYVAPSPVAAPSPNPPRARVAAGPGRSSAPRNTRHRTGSTNSDRRSRNTARGR